MQVPPKFFDPCMILLVGNPILPRKGTHKYGNTNTIYHMVHVQHLWYGESKGLTILLPAVLLWEQDQNRVFTFCEMDRMKRQVMTSSDWYTKGRLTTWTIASRPAQCATVNIDDSGGLILETGCNHPQHTNFCYNASNKIFSCYPRHCWRICTRSVFWEFTERKV